MSERCRWTLGIVGTLLALLILIKWDWGQYRWLPIWAVLVRLRHGRFDSFGRQWMGSVE
jgi:hypothetical protein